MGLKEAAKGMTQKQLGTVATAVGKTATGIVANAGKEAGQEYLQEMGQIFNAQFGTEKHGSDIGAIVTDLDNMAQGVTAAGLGAGGALQFQALGAVGSIPKKVTQIRDAIKPKDSVDEPSDVSEAPTKKRAFTRKVRATKPETEIRNIAAETVRGTNDELGILGSDASDVDKMNKMKELIELASEDGILDDKLKSEIGRAHV